jgi:DNA-directed RNA polymerase specialized sigma24 family protein
MRAWQELVAGRDRVRRIGLAAQQLPARQRRVLAGGIGHDLTHDAIVERMGPSQGAVKLLQYRRSGESGRRCHKVVNPALSSRSPGGPVR